MFQAFVMEDLGVQQNKCVSIICLEEGKILLNIFLYILLYFFQKAIRVLCYNKLVRGERMIDFTIEIPVFQDKVYSIMDFGAETSLNYNNQKAIQSAIDFCSQNGGGKVIVPNGYFRSGPIELKSDVHLFLEDNAYIKFTKSKEEYPLIWTDFEGKKRIRAISPISARYAKNIAITGKGIIDGNGFAWRGIKKFKMTEKEWERCLKISPYVVPTKEGGIWCPTKSYYEGIQLGEPDYNDSKALQIASEHYDVYRPVLLSLQHCDRVLIEEVTLQNSPAWNVHPYFCTNFTMKNAVIKNKFYAQNGDGIDLESCQNCEIVGTVFEVGDDGICIKSGKNREARQIEGPCKNVWIHDCKVFDAHGGFVVGSEMSRGVEHIFVEDCTFVGTDIGIRFKSAIGRGGVVKDIHIKNISMIDIVEEAFIFTLGYSLSTLEKTNSDSVDFVAEDDYPEFKEVYMENITCHGAKIGIKIQGLEEKKIHHLQFKDIEINSSKALSLTNAHDIKFLNVRICAEDENVFYKDEVM